MFLYFLTCYISVNHLARLLVVIIVLFIFIVFLVNIYLVTLFICLIKSQVVTYKLNSLFTICKFVLAFSVYITILVYVANHNVNFVKQIKMLIK